MKRNYDTTPLLLQEAARSWLSLYAGGIEEQNASRQIAAIVCLFFAIELYLKAYLALKAKRFSKEEELKNLSHDFRRILTEIEAIGPADFASEVRQVLCKYNLLCTNFIDLRYPKAGRGLTVDRDLFSGRHCFDRIIEHIDREIAGWDYAHWKALPA